MPPNQQKQQYEEVRQDLMDMHVEVIIPDALGKPIYRQCHLTALSATQILSDPRIAILDKEQNTLPPLDEYTCLSCGANTQMGMLKANFRRILPKEE